MMVEIPEWFFAGSQAQSFPLLESSLHPHLSEPQGTALWFPSHTN